MTNTYRPNAELLESHYSPETRALAEVLCEAAWELTGGEWRYQRQPIGKKRIWLEKAEAAIVRLRPKVMRQAELLRKAVTALEAAGLSEEADRFRSEIAALPSWDKE